MKDIVLKSISDIYLQKAEIKNMFKDADVNFFINLRAKILSDIKYGFYMVLAEQYTFHMKKFYL